MKTGIRIVTLALCAAMTLGFSACGNKSVGGSGDNKTVASGKKVTLLVDLHGWDPTINKTATAENPTVFQSPQKIADAFTKMYPNVTIKWARSKPVGGDKTSLAQWFTTQIAAGNCPQIAFSWGTGYQDRDWYLDLDKYLNQPNPYISGNKKWRDAFPKYLWSNSSIETLSNQVVAVPIALYPGSPTGYYYNQTAFAKAGITGAPKTWEELLTDTKKLKAAGYVGLEPWSYFKSASADSWVAQFIIGPSVAGYLIGQTDLNKDGKVDGIEQLRATLKGVYNPVTHDYAKTVYQQQKRYYTEVLDTGWESTDFYSKWNLGQVGIREEGLWAYQAENSNKARKFDYGVFPAPLMSKDTSLYSVNIEYTKKGPYQPDPDLELNIMKDSVKDHPELLDAAVKFLQYMTTPKNNSLMILENGSDIGAVLGCEIPPLLKTWLSNPFPKTPNAKWPTAFTDEQSLTLNNTFQMWVKGQITDDAFYQKVNEVQVKGAKDYISKMKIDTSKW